MNKLLKVTLITAIMATSGMCSGGNGNPFPQRAPQQDSCGPMMKLALCAAAGYVAYKMCCNEDDGYYHRSDIKHNNIMNGRVFIPQGILEKFKESHMTWQSENMFALNSLGDIKEEDRIIVVQHDSKLAGTNLLGYRAKIGPNDNNGHLLIFDDKRFSERLAAQHKTGDKIEIKYIKEKEFREMQKEYKRVPGVKKAFREKSELKKAAKQQARSVGNPESQTQLPAAVINDDPDDGNEK